MTEPFYSGYPAQVWGTCWQSISWLNSLLTANTADLCEPVECVIETVRNGLSSLSAWHIGAVLSAEVIALNGVQALPISLDPSTTTYFSTRIATISTIAPVISALAVPANPFTATILLASGQPAIADPMFLEWCMAFSGETAPIGLTPDTLPDYASAMTQAWLDVTNAINVLQGNSPTSAYDIAARQYRCSAVVSAKLAQLLSGPFSQQDTDTLWNQAVVLPSIFLDANTLCANPSSLVSQQIGAIRYALAAQTAELSLLYLALRFHSVTNPSVDELRNYESLQDMAARVTGDFENWKTLAALNSLTPPWPGPTNPDLALSGQPLFLSGNNITPILGENKPTYLANVLGIDWDFGPINGTMPAWKGDIPLITGYLNFARAIGRRLQTSLGSLIYHTDYGSRIPPEVGAIQSIDEAAKLNEYGRSAIAADPRTGSILASNASVQPGFLANFNASIQPIGSADLAVTVNEVLGVNR